MAIFSARLFFFFPILFGHGIFELEASHHIYQTLQNLDEFASATSQPHRTGYHFQPPKNWMNDPNGPMIYKGIYHLFYQYNPKGAVWGNIVWAHSTSRDLVNWTPQKLAIYPSQRSAIDGAWSGSATIFPDEWVKSPKNPVMAPTPENQINASSFRDPTTAWLGADGRWKVVIGSRINCKGLAYLYRSKDFVYWIKAKTLLHSAEDTGMWECVDFFPVSVNSSVGVDMLSILGPNVKYVFKASLDDTKHDYYTVGEYDPVKDVYTPDEGSVDGDSGLRYDYGKFYASKSFFDSAKNRMILWGWINESSSVSDDIKKGWSGIQAIPRVIWLDKSGKQLLQWPIKEIEMLRTNAVHLPRKVLQGGSVLEVPRVTAAQADVEITFKVSHFRKAEGLDPSWTNPQLLCSQKGASVRGSLGPFGLLVFASKGMQEYTSVFFRIFKGQNKYVVLMCSDQSRSSLNPDNDKTTYGAFVDVDPVHEHLSLRSLIDHSVVESFGGQGKSCMTARVYPILAINEDAHLHAFNNGSKSVTITRLSAWSMKKANIN
ncbi:hypothetical protein P3X46_034229 [Hevea brasiliensis]|uniref:Uncharacterized protein n=1 Tax=Hevea brasiliensis TaxID=3981 RepID=A0ABQ9K8X4_HEVBR|nr:hypothetical protein P3X46_034229 [Hevea brasiliensis]